MSFEKHIEGLVRNDRLNIEPSAVNYLKLVRHLKVNSVLMFVHKNAFVPVIGFKNRMGINTWKYGVAVAIFLMVLYAPKMGKESSLFVQNDTINNIQFVDSTSLDSIGAVIQ